MLVSALVQLLFFLHHVASCDGGADRPHQIDQGMRGVYNRLYALVHELEGYRLGSCLSDGLEIVIVW